MGLGRYFVYRYEGNLDTDEVEFDRYLEMPIPKQNSVVERKAVKWRVACVQVELVSTSSPIFRVFLSRLPKASTAKTNRL